jgi:hypothetical protein
VGASFIQKRDHAVNLRTILDPTVPFRPGPVSLWVARNRENN